jgi:hypothetical protein
MIHRVAIMQTLYPALIGQVLKKISHLYKQKHNLNEFDFNKLIFHKYSGSDYWALGTSVVGYKGSFQFRVSTLHFLFPSSSP